MLLCRFADAGLEKAYQDYMLDRHARFDMIALAIGVAVYFSYIAMDLMVLERAREAILIRLGGASACVAVMFAIHAGLLGRRLDRIVPVMIVAIGMLLNLIIRIEPSIENNYYIGLVQIAVFISFMLRAGFIPTNLAMAALFGGYLWAIADKGLFGTVTLNAQLYFLSMMFATCGCGIYLLERYRRRLFLNSKVIDEQNAKLEMLVEELEDTVTRKTAMLKVFTHVMKTPVHQIVGFLQVIRGEMSEANARSGSVDYAEKAAAELRENVEEMVDYHFVDNVVLTGEPDKVNIHENLDEVFYREIDAGVLTIVGDRTTIRSHQEIFWMAMKYLERYYRDRNAGKITVELKQSDAGCVIEFSDDLPAMDADEFRRVTCQLTEIHNYLSGEGANPDMTLRIVMRALQQIDAEIYPSKSGGGFYLRFPAEIAELAA
ncbi:MAG: hypothetical protein KDA46_00985 [Parvularculaceae bacterium]|nr:hypothetical protein [Parvularculaceae bacterium]